MSKINHKLSMSFIIPLLIIAVISVCGISISNKATIDSSNRSIFSSILAGCSSYIGYWQQKNASAMEKYAALPEDKKLKLKSLSNPTLAGVMTNASGAVTAYFADESDGRLYLTEGTEELFNSGFDPRKRAWYTDAVASPDHAIFSEPYIDVITKQMVITVAKRAKNGVVGADFTTQDILDIINGLSIPGDGFAVLTFGAQNQILAYSNTELINQPLDSLDSHLTTELSKEILASSADSNPMEVSLSDGRTMMVMGMPIANSSWKLFVFINKDYFYGSYNKTMISFIIGFAVFFLLFYFITRFFIYNKLVKPIEDVSEHLRKMSDGEINLTDRLIISTGDEIESMNNSLSAFVARQHDNIIKLSDKMRESVSMADANNKLISSEINNQNENITGVVDIIQNIHSVTHDIMDVTDNTIKSIDNIHTTSNNGLSIVAETETAMRSLSDSISSTQSAVQSVARHTDEIARLSENIKTIAEQTNLLALNAAIESARAGEHGRGFAVVADEVRNLAVKTRESTEEIQKTVEALIGNMKSTLEKVTKSTADCTLTIERNKETVAFLTDIISQIETTSTGAKKITDYASRQSGLISAADAQIEKINAAQTDIRTAVNSISSSTSEMQHSSETIIRELLQN
ncbi:MAG: HAMP domain-containing protein [Succinimonas sp.]|nr:HAMP domain-containing protein [Succinimonas sp.]